MEKGEERTLQLGRGIKEETRSKRSWSPSADWVEKACLETKMTRNVKEKNQKH